MFIPANHPDVLIETMLHEPLEPELTSFARQMSYFTQHTIQEYYTTDLGLERIDQDPAPGTPEELAWRIGHLQTASSRDVAYTVARRLTEQGNHQVAVDAIVGLLVTQRHTTTNENERPVLELVEFDVEKAERGKGLGRLLLQHVMQEVEDEASIILDVAEANTAARALYEHYGFQQYGEPIEHGVFAVQHLPLATDSAVLKQRLGV